MEQQLNTNKQLLMSLNNFPLRTCREIISYLDEESINNIYICTSRILVNCKQSANDPSKLGESGNLQKIFKENIFGKTGNNQQKLTTKSECCKQLPFLLMIAISALINKHIRSTDRAMYMGIYEQPVLKQYQSQLIEQIVGDPDNGTQLIKQWILTDFIQADLYLSMQQLLSKMAIQTSSEVSQVSQIIDETKLIINDPQIPVPKLRKQGIGSHCNSFLQFYLIDTWHPSNKIYKKNKGNSSSALLDLLTPLTGSNLQQKIDLADIFDQYENHGNQDNEYQRKHQMKQQKQQFQFSTYKYHLIKIVTKLLHNYCQISQKWVLTQNGDFQKLFTFINRFSIYRAIIIGIQDLFGGIFRSQDSQFITYKSYRILQKNSGNGFIDIGMRLWEYTMKQFTFGNLETYTKVLHHYTHSTMTSMIQAEQQIENSSLTSAEHRWLSSTLKLNRISISQIQHTHKLHRSQSFMSQTCLNEIEEYFLEDGYMQEQILREFLQYYIDYSVDQISVNWCGHSDQVFFERYKEIERQTFQYGKFCLKYFEDICHHAKRENSNPKIVLEYLIKKLYNIWESGLVKPVTLSKMVEFSKKAMNVIAQSLDKKQNQQFNRRVHHEDLQGTQNRSEFPFELNFTESDKIIEYHNLDVWKIERSKENSK